MKTYNIKYSSCEEIEYFIKRHQLANKENILVQVFTGKVDVTFIHMLTTLLTNAIPHVKIVGTTTSGEICGDNVSDDETVLSFSIFEDTIVETFGAKHHGDSIAVAHTLLKQFPQGKKAQVAITFSDGIHFNGDTYMRTLSEYDDTLIISGGMAGDNTLFKETIVFTESKIFTAGAVIALLYNENLHVSTTANFGWQSIGKKLTVTKAEGNVLQGVDGITPVALYAKYLGEDIKSQLPGTGVKFPLIIHRDGQEIARAVAGKNEDGTLIFGGSFEVGDKIKFGYGNVESIMHGGKAVYEKLKDTECESIFVYSCLARKSLLGENIAMELKHLADLAPMSGFFTYGEFFTKGDTSSSKLLNVTMTILGLSEGTNPSKKSDDSAFYMDMVDPDITSKALSHLVAQTSRELEEVNRTLEQRIETEIEKNRIQTQQLMQQSRMAQMGELISMIAHQWRQPLSTISSTLINIQVKMMTEHFDLDSKNGIEMCQTFLLEKLENMDGYVQGLSTTIDDFRNFYNPNKTHRTVNINEPIQKALSIIEASLHSKGVHVITKLQSQKEMALFDSELMQVLLNLIKNAQDSILDKAPTKPTIIIRTSDIKEGIRVEVEDNGGGIPEEIKTKIFNPYFSTKDERNGTGLGLYMTKTIIEDHHKGKLWVENINDGALFVIEIVV